MNSTDENTTNQKDAILVLNDIYKNKIIYIGTANVSNTNATFTVNEKSKLIIKKRVKENIQEKWIILILVIGIIVYHYWVYKPELDIFWYYFASIMCILPIPYYQFISFFKGFNTTVFKLKNLSIRAENDLYKICMINYEDDRLILLNTTDRDRYNNNDFVELSLRQILDLLETPTQLEIAMGHPYWIINNLLRIISISILAICFYLMEVGEVYYLIMFIVISLIFRFDHLLPRNTYTEIISEKLEAIGVYSKEFSTESRLLRRRNDPK